MPIDRAAIDAVIFDLDGTLINSTEAIVGSFFYTFDKIGEPRPSSGAIVSSISLVLEDQIAQFTDRDPEECARIYREHYVKVAADTTRLHLGAEYILESLNDADTALGIATSKRRSSAEPLLEALGIWKFFKVCIGPEDVENPKPDPEPLQKAAHVLEVPVERAVYIGDTYLDVRAAAAAGMPSIAVTTGYGSEDELRSSGPDAMVESLYEARDLILGEDPKP